MSYIEITILITIICCGFYVQTVSGFAAALITMPLLLFVTDLQTAIAVMSVLLLFSSIILIPKEWANINKKLVFKLAFATIVGMILGISTLEIGNPYILKKILGGFVILYVIYSLKVKTKHKFFGKYASLFGLVGGFFSGLFATGGPFYVIHISNSLTKPDQIRATIIGILGITNLTRIILLSGYEMIDLRILKLVFLIIPFLLASIYLGHKTYYKLNQQIFSKVLMILLAMSGIASIVF